MTYKNYAKYKFYVHKQVFPWNTESMSSLLTIAVWSCNHRVEPSGPTLSALKTKIVINCPFTEKNILLSRRPNMKQMPSASMS